MHVTSWRHPRVCDWTQPLPFFLASPEQRLRGQWYFSVHCAPCLLTVELFLKVENQCVMASVRNEPQWWMPRCLLPWNSAASRAIRAALRKWNAFGNILSFQGRRILEIPLKQKQLGETKVLSQGTGQKLGLGWADLKRGEWWLLKSTKKITAWPWSVFVLFSQNFASGNYKEPNLISP